MLQSRCRECHRPSSYLTIDEQLIGFRGRAPFCVHMKSKPDKYGLKVWVLADAENAYAFNSQIYLGKQGDTVEVGQARRVVHDLISPVTGTGRNVTFDNFFTSVGLAEDLMKENLTILGTIRANKREIPPDFQKSALREVHSTRFGFARDMTLVSYVPKKGKAVLLLSTLHNQPEISDREDRKPIVVLDYNKTKGTVDTID